MNRLVHRAACLAAWLAGWTRLQEAAVWLVLLAVPGSCLLLPLWLWWKHRGSRGGALAPNRTAA